MSHWSDAWSVGVVVFSGEGVIRAANARFAALVGRAEVVGADYWALTVPGQKNREINEILGRRDGFEKEFVGPDGRGITARVVSTGLTADGDYVVAVQAADAAGDDRGAVERTLRRQNAILLELAKVDAVDAGRVEDAFRAITEASAKGVGCERSSIWLYDASRTSIVCQDLYRISEQDHGLKGFTLTAGDFPGYFAALAEDRTIAADDAHQHPATREFSAGYLTPLGIASMLEAPIRRGGVLIGVLCHEHVGASRRFTQEEMNFAASVAEIVTRALEAGARREADDRLRDAHALLERHAANLEVTVAERTRSIQLILDNTGEGLLACDLTGALTGERSRVVEGWFGAPAAGASAAAFLFPDEGQRLAFEIGFSQIVDDVLPFELLAEQMPSELRRGDRTYRIRYRAVEDGGAVSRVLMIVRDATAEVAAERAEVHARELQAMASHLLKDRQGFRAFLAEFDDLVGQLSEAADPVEKKRTLHTIKGNSAIFGLGSIARLAHHVEDQIAESGEVSEHVLRPVVRSWEETRERFGAVFGADANAAVELSEAEYRAFLADIVALQVDGPLVERVRSWARVPAASVLERLASQARRVAVQLGKEVEIEVHGGEIRLPLRETGAFWSSLVHVVRNAVDHGLEDPAARAEAGKPTAGALSITVEERGEALVVQICDDGRGIDFERVAEKAAALGLPHATHADRVAALFADGLSTRDEATELSGRGVGLSAVAAACAALGGRTTVEASVGVGTRFVFTLPRRSAAAAA